MKILIAGNKELSRPVTRSFLDRSDCELLRCTGGRETLDLAEKERPDLIILGDVADPGPVDCWRRLHEAKNTADLPVLLILEQADRATAPTAAAQADPGDAEGVLQQAARLLALRRREHRRRPVKTRVDFYRKDREYVGHTRDLSESGMFLRSDADLEPGDRVQLIFDLPTERGKTIRAEGEVARRQASPEAETQPRAGLGIRFRRVGARDRRAIADLVSRTAGVFQ